MSLNKQSLENKSNLLIQQNQQSLIVRTSLKLLVLKTTLLTTLQLKINDIGRPFSWFHLNINSLLFHFDELESLISKSKNDSQIIRIPETRLKKTQEITTNIQLKILIVNMYQLNQQVGECCCISEKQLTIN